jgi:hypothetical protein
MGAFKPMRPRPGNRLASVPVRDHALPHAMDRQTGAATILRAQEALGWLCLVEKSERRYLAFQALAADAGLPIRAMLRARGWSRTSFYRTVGSAVSRIAAALDELGVPLR